MTRNNFRLARNPTRIDAKCGDHVLQPELSGVSLPRSYSSKTNVSSDLLILILRLWYSMKPSFLNLFMKKFTRERVVPIISDKVSWETIGSSASGWCCTFRYRPRTSRGRATRFSHELKR